MVFALSLWRMRIGEEEALYGWITVNILVFLVIIHHFLLEKHHHSFLFIEGQPEDCGQFRFGW